jgi:hypothetical protein
MNLGGTAVKLGQVARHGKIPMQSAALICQVKVRLEETVAIARGRGTAAGNRAAVMAVDEGHRIIA